MIRRADIGEAMRQRHGSGGDMASATIALASAAVFILVAASLGLALDREPGPSSTWHLRGSLSPGTLSPNSSDRPRVDHTPPVSPASIG